MGRQITAPVYYGWGAFHAVERKLYQRGKTHACCVVIDETGVGVDVGSSTAHFTREALGDLAPSFQFPARGAVLEGHRIVRWVFP